MHSRASLPSSWTLAVPPKFALQLQDRRNPTRALCGRSSHVKPRMAATNCAQLRATARNSPPQQGSALNDVRLRSSHCPDTDACAYQTRRKDGVESNGASQGNVMTAPVASYSFSIQTPRHPGAETPFSSAAQVVNRGQGERHIPTWAGKQQTARWQAL